MKDKFAFFVFELDRVSFSTPDKTQSQLDTQIAARYAAFWHAIPQIALVCFLLCP